MFNKCFYDAIPLLLTKHTSEAFKEINSACSLATQCLQSCPYWIFLRLLRLHTYPLWTHFADIRSHILGFLHVLAPCTLPHGHVLRPLLELWTRANLETGKGSIAAILRLSSDLLGPSSLLEIEEWAWVQDEICSLHYQLGGFSDALVIAERFAQDENVPPGVRISSLQMTLDLCEQHYYDSSIARFLPQTYSDLAYLFNLMGEYGQSFNYYRESIAESQRSPEPGQRGINTMSHGGNEAASTH
ncbi:hypothetical protein LTS15_009513 [Exophiala xenobiotica]|nr:hypothetical protein LTS15_009513 [Exophiala xenobiotica]